MKKLTLLCVAGALFAACSNELEPSTTPSAVKVTAIATTDSDNDTRLAFEEDNEAHKLKVTWEESGESFPVFVGSNSEAPAIFTQTGSSTNHKTATFSGSVSAQAGDVIHAIYPRYTSYDATTGFVELFLHEQDGSCYDADNAYMYVQATYTDENTPLNFEFKHLTAALKATVKFPQGVTGTATNVKLVASNRIYGTHIALKSLLVYSTSVSSRNDIAFMDENGNPTEFPIVDGKITVYANLFAQRMSEFRLVAKVGDKYYTAMLMDSKELKAGAWYYPVGEAKEMTELQGFTVDEAAHTIDITTSDVLSFYAYDDIKDILCTVIDSQTGLLKITGSPSSFDLVEIGKITRDLASENNSTLLKVLDMSGCTGFQTFSGEMSGVTSLEKIVLPNTTTRIGINAFTDCTSLAEINLENIERIGSGAFENCISLTDVNLDKLKEIGIGTFENCISIRNFDLPSLTHVTSRSFGGTKIVNFNAPNITSLSSSLFSDATISGVINLPRCQRVSSSAFADINKNSDQTFTLKLTAGGYLRVQGGNIFKNTATENINLVINPAFQTSETDANVFNRWTFKSITYEEPKDDI